MRHTSGSIAIAVAGLVILSAFAAGPARSAETPHIIFVMADDMGWGETGYRNHPVLETPNLDAMAAGGLRFERFYAGGPVCSPTRAAMLTGRTHDRTGVLTHGYALRTQEKTIAEALRGAGYVTGHFGKWHLSGLSGPGAPILASDPRHPGRFGFDEWVSTSNFFDLDPLVSRAGKIEAATGDSSEIVVASALEFLERHRGGGQPMFAVIWFGSPHRPYRALAADREAFAELDEASANHYGELVALDRSVGTLRRRLRELGLADDTLLVFCSDNGGLPGISSGTVGGLRGHKGSVFEGGIRVPGIIEWPAVIKPRVTEYPACVMDLFPTIREIVGLPDVVASMKRQLLDWDRGVDASFAGKDYPEGRVDPPDPKPVNWSTVAEYQPFLDEWRKRWEYRDYLEGRAGQRGTAGQPRRTAVKTSGETD